MKIRSVTIRVIAALTIILLMFMALPRFLVSAAISLQQPWTTAYTGAAFPGTYSYTVNGGANRMLVVAVSSSITAAGTQTATVTYGGQSLTLQVGDAAASSRTHTYLFYLQDTPAVMDGAAHNLVVTVTGGTARWNYVYAAVYAGVDQSANPITNSQNYNSLAAQAAPVGPFATPLTIGNGDQAVEIINLTRTATPARTVTTWAANWSSAIGPNSSAAFTSAYVATSNTIGTTTSQHTASGTCYRSMSAMSIKPYTVSPQQDWSTVYTGAAFPGTYSYTVNGGANRMLVVAVSSSITAAGTQTATVTYGGQSLTLQVGDAAASSRTHTYLFYLQDTPAVMDGAAHNLVVTVTGGTARWNYVYAAVYAGVDQSANPITNSQNYNSLAVQAAPVGPFATPLTIGNGDQAVEIINLTRTATPARTVTTWAANWSPAIGPNSSAAFTSAYVARNNTSGTTASQHTASGTCYRSMSAMSIKMFVATPTPTSTSTRTYTPTVTDTPTVTETPTETLTPTETPMCYPDGYEPDDSYPQAGIIPSDGTTQDHLNTPPTDEDWVRFYAPAGHSYEIRTMLLNDIDSADNAANDTLLYLYDTDGTTQLAFNDDVGYTTWYMGYYYYRESIITWTAPAAGWYYVRELQWGPTAGYTIRDCHSYRIWVEDTTPPTPTFTPTNTPTLTLTITPTLTPTLTLTNTPTYTPIPLAGASSVRFAALLLNAPDFGLAAQTIRGSVQGGGGPPYTAAIYIRDPDGNVETYGQNVESDGTFELTPAESNTYLGCNKEGIWEAWFVVTDSLGGTATSNLISWTVNFPRVHGIP